MHRIRFSALLLAFATRLNGIEPAPPLADLRGVWRSDFNSDGSRLIVQMREGGLGIWSVDDGRHVSGDLGILASSGTYVIDGQAKYALVGFEEGGSRVFDLATGRALSPRMDASFEGSWLPPAGFSTDGTRIHVFEKTGACRIFEVASGKNVATLALPADSGDREIESRMDFTEDGGTAILLDEAGSLRRYDTRNWKEQGPALPHPDAEAYHIDFAVSPDGRHAVTFDHPGENGPEGQLQLWDLVGSRPVGGPLRAKNGMSGQFIDRGNRLIVMPGRGETRVVKVPSLEEDFVMPRHDDVEASWAATVSGGKYLLSWGNDSSVRSLEAASGKHAAIFSRRAQVADVLSGKGFVWLALDNTAFFVEGHYDYYVVKLDPGEMRPLATLRITDYLHRTILSPDATRLMIHQGGTGKERIRLFNASTLAELPSTAGR